MILFSQTFTIARRNGIVYHVIYDLAILHWVQI